MNGCLAIMNDLNQVYEMQKKRRELISTTPIKFKYNLDRVKLHVPIAESDVGRTAWPYPVAESEIGIGRL